MVLRTTYFASSFSLGVVSAMTLERYIGVLHPYYYETKVTKKRILCYVCTCGLVSFSLFAYSFRNLIFSTNISRALLALIFLLILLAFVRIYFVIRKLICSEKRPACQNDGNRNALTLRESRHATSCFLVVICFVFLAALRTIFCQFQLRHC